MKIPKLNRFWKYVEYWAEIEPDFPTIRFGKRKIITAREFSEKTDQLAKIFLDMGVKLNILRNFAQRRIEIIVVPCNYSFDQII